MTNHDKYITTQKFNNSTAGRFTARLRQAKLATKFDIKDFQNQTDFDEELINVYTTVTLNNARYVQAEKKLNEDITYYKKLINNLN